MRGAARAVGLLAPRPLYLRRPDAVAPGHAQDGAPLTPTLRPMRWWDIDVVMPLERDLFPDLPWSAAGFWSELAGVPQTRSYVVAEDDGELVGYAGMSRPSLTRPTCRRWRARGPAGRGFGATLLEALVGEARHRGESRHARGARGQRGRHRAV